MFELLNSIGYIIDSQPLNKFGQHCIFIVQVWIIVQLID